MYKLYILLFLLAVVCGAYFAGGQVARQRCNARVACLFFLSAQSYYFFHKLLFIGKKIAFKINTIQSVNLV